MKKALLVLLCLVMVFTLASCAGAGGTAPGQTGGTDNPTPLDETQRAGNMVVQITPEFIKAFVDRQMGEKTPLSDVNVSFEPDNTISVEAIVDVSRMADFLKNEGSADDTAVALIKAAGMLMGTVDVMLEVSVDKVTNGVPEFTVSTLQVADLSIPSVLINTVLCGALESAITDGLDNSIFVIEDIRTQDGKMLLYLCNR